MKPVRFLGRWIRTRAQRRAVVTTMYASFAITIGFGVLAGLSHIRWLGYLEFPGIFLCAWGFLALSKMTRRYALQDTCSNPEMADERQAKVRDNAMARSYLIVSLILMGVVLWMEMGTDSPKFWRPANFSEWQPVFWGVMLLTSTLPQAMIAWKEPDDLEDEPASPGHVAPAR